MRHSIMPTLAAVIMGVAASSARAERHPEEMIALGFQTEHADIVALARPGPTTVDADSATLTAGFQVERSIRGDVAAGARLTVVHRDLGHASSGHDGRAWEDGRLYLVFLRTLPDSDEPRYESESGAFGFRSVTEGTPSARFPEIAAQIAATLGEGTHVRDRATLRTLLANLATDTDDGVAASAALDLARHTTLASGLDDAQRLALLESFRARAPGRARRQIALAVAAAPHVEAAPALVDGLLAPNARIDRGGLVEALFRLADPRAEERILQRLPQADQGQTENLLVALGKIGGNDAVEPLIARVSDPAATVRVEAAHALGNVARNVHRATPGEVVAGRVELIALLNAALLESGEIRPGGRNEVRAALWALAQLDDPRAFAALREISAQADRGAAVRDCATRILERPRMTLVLD